LSQRSILVNGASAHNFQNQSPKWIKVTFHSGLAQKGNPTLKSAGKSDVFTTLLDLRVDLLDGELKKLRISAESNPRSLSNIIQI